MVIASDVTVNSNFGYVNLIVTEAHRVPPSANENAKKKIVQTGPLGIRPSVLLLGYRHRSIKGTPSSNSNLQKQAATASSNSKQQKQAATARANSKQAPSSKQQAASSNTSRSKQQAASSKQQHIKPQHSYAR